jgi:hypothetical protein
MEIAIGFDNFEILKIDDRDFTVEINAYLIVKWKDARIIIDFAHVRENKIENHFRPYPQLITCFHARLRRNPRSVDQLMTFYPRCHFMQRGPTFCFVVLVVLLLVLL